MSDKNWTPAQQDAINARGGSLLVSAAAGSGKTAVLVERVISLITDPVNPIDADRILVVTFTRAAAAQMKDRISKALADLIEREPEKTYLRRQQILLNKAQISTVHSFCMNLVSENFQKLGLAPDFHIADENRLNVFKLQAVNEVVDEIYNEDSAVYKALSEIFGTDKNDNKLTETIINLNRFISAYPFPNTWLAEKAKMYRNVKSMPDTPWGDFILKGAKEVILYSRSSISECLSLISENESVKTAYGRAFESDLEKIDELYSATEKKDWDLLFSLLSSLKWERLNASRDKSTVALRENLKSARKDMRDAIESIKLKMCVSQELCIEDINRTAVFVDAIFEAVQEFRKRFTQIKRSKNAVDFNDLEQFAISLLVNETENGYERTNLAIALSEKFDEIMIDEYQDTNKAQDLIFCSLSKNEENLFAVGDLKQSIYGFRQAMPDLFIARKNAYFPYSRENEQYPACISLDKNFRSRKNVTDSVNFFFEQLMTLENGDVDYISGEQLQFGAQYYENIDLDTELVIIDDAVSEENADIIEAEYISEKINKMFDENMQIRDPDSSVMRTVRPGDICILLRNYNSHAPLYVQQMKKYGLDVISESSGGFFDTKEIAFIVSLLRVIDNPMQDIPLISVMMSPVYGFSADEISQMRINSPTAKNLYLALLSYSEKQKFKDFLSEIERLRLLAAQMSVSEFIVTLYNATGFLDIASAMPRQGARIENLHTLQSYAKNYDSFSGDDLHGFVKYLNHLEQIKAKLSENESATSNSDNIRIMSIHKSKGLEFPVCILAGCSRRFNREKDDALIDMDLGFGIRLRGYNGMHKYTTAIREAIGDKLLEDSVSEELRVLYVALTRAKEKLIMVMTVKNPEKKLSALSIGISEKTALRPYSVKKASSISDWLLMCALRHSDSDKLRDLANAENLNILYNSKNKLKISVIDSEIKGLIKQEEINETIALPDEDFIKKLKRNFEFKYPYEALRFIPSKISASGVAERKNKIRSFSRPAFLSSKGMTPAERGTAIHTFMQFCNLENARNNLEEEISYLREHGFITLAQAQAIDRKKIKAFFADEISRKIQNAEKCIREYRFTSRIFAKEIYEEISPEVFSQELILQGALDCIIVEPDGVVIIDYKTDRINSEKELVALYFPQLDLYRKAAEKIFKKPVKKCFIYSFHMEKTIAII